MTSRAREGLRDRCGATTPWGSVETLGQRRVFWAAERMGGELAIQCEGPFLTQVLCELSRVPWLKADAH